MNISEVRHICNFSEGEHAEWKQRYTDVKWFEDIVLKCPESVDSVDLVLTLKRRDLKMSSCAVENDDRHFLYYFVKYYSH